MTFVVCLTLGRRAYVVQTSRPFIGSEFLGDEALSALTLHVGLIRA